MADDHKVKVEQDANRIADWLTKHRAEFERDGIEEAALSTSVGLTEHEARKAVDYLEHHEDVVRRPQALTAPPRFLQSGESPGYLRLTKQPTRQYQNIRDDYEYILS
jgi:hypothetical protein